MTTFFPVGQEGENVPESYVSSSVGGAEDGVWAKANLTSSSSSSSSSSGLVKEMRKEEDTVVTRFQ